MKAVWFSLILLITLPCLIFANTTYVCNAIDSLCQATETLSDPEQIDQALPELENLWQHHRSKIILSANPRDVKEIDKALINVKWAHKVGNSEEFERHRLSLLDQFQEIARSESFHWQNIF